MFLPIGDAPNPKGTPFVTYALIAANVAAFLLLNVPLGSRQADASDPGFRDYVEVMTRELQGRADVTELARPDERLRPLLVRARLPLIRWSTVVLASARSQTAPPLSRRWRAKR